MRLLDKDEQMRTSNNVTFSWLSKTFTSWRLSIWSTKIFTLDLNLSNIDVAFSLGHPNARILRSILCVDLKVLVRMDET